MIKDLIALKFVSKFLILVEDKRPPAPPVDYFNRIVIPVIIICAGISLLFLIINIIKLIIRNKKERNTSDFKFSEFIEKEISEEKLEEIDISRIKYFEEKKEKEEPKEVYTKQDKHVQDEESGFSVKEYLSSKGFNLDYSSLNDEEKNKIMLELMMLKDNHKITQDEYLMETYELWKK